MSAANALHLAVAGGDWHRIVLDSGIIFWHIRKELSLPTPEEDSGQYGQHPIVDLGMTYDLISRRIVSVGLSEEVDADELVITFDNGFAVALRASRDVDATGLALRAPAS